MSMSERDARGPEDNDKPGFILGESASSPVENWSGARPARLPHPNITVAVLLESERVARRPDAPFARVRAPCLLTRKRGRLSSSWSRHLWCLTTSTVRRRWRVPTAGSVPGGVRVATPVQPAIFRRPRRLQEEAQPLDLGLGVSAGEGTH